MYIVTLCCGIHFSFPVLILSFSVGNNHQSEVFRSYLSSLKSNLSIYMNYINCSIMLFYFPITSCAHLAFSLMSYFFFQKEQLHQGIKAMAKEREKWLGSASRLIRAARHHEGAAQILIRHAVMTARKVNFLQLRSVNKCNR